MKFRLGSFALFWGEPLGPRTAVSFHEARENGEMGNALQEHHKGGKIVTLVIFIGIFLLTFITVSPVKAASSGVNKKIEDTLQGDWGKINFNIRWRFEHAYQAGKETANGDPIRLRLGYLTPERFGFQAFAEFEGNTPVFVDDYNSTRNGKTQFAVITDPTAAELNQGWLAFSGMPDTIVKVGRQNIIYNNQRFVSNAPWRQLGRTFDAVDLVNRSIGNADLKFAFIWNVRNINSENVNMTSPILNLGYTFPNVGKLTTYGYLLDYTDAYNSGPFPFAFSTQTYGIRFNGATPVANNLDALYTTEYAFQANFENNPKGYNADYFHLIAGLRVPEAGAAFSDVTGKVGWEYMGSDHGVSFQTPLGTKHPFEGWADQFAITPTDGVMDLYADLSAMFFGVKMQVCYHQFNAAEGGANYGHEIDALVSKKFAGHYTLLAAYANYLAKDFKTNTNKFWLQVEANF